MCSTAWASAGSKPAISSIAPPHQVVAERDLALQAAGVGEVDRQRILVIGLGLADVVQQRAGDRDVAIDAGEEGGGRGDRLGDRDRVLEQAVAVGLVVDLCRRSVAEALPVRGCPRRRSGRAARAAAGPARSRAARAGRSRGAIERDRRSGGQAPRPRYSSAAASRSSASLIFAPQRSLTSKTAA